MKVRPVSTEAIEVAESQYYHNTVNRFGQPLRQSHEKTDFEKPKISVTTYKPTFQLLKDMFSSEDEEALSNVESMEIAKVTANTEKNEEKPTTVANEEGTEKFTSPGEIDLGTGSPDPTVDDLFNTPTEPTTVQVENISKLDRFSFMDYLFGVTSEEHDEEAKNETRTTGMETEITTEVKPKMITTESSYIPEEITEASEPTDNVAKVETTSKTTDAPKPDATTNSVFMNVNAMSTSMSTEVSHETEICFRGKCIKTSKDIL